MISKNIFEYLRCKSRMQKTNICNVIFEYVQCIFSQIALHKMDICNVDVFNGSAVALQKKDMFAKIAMQKLNICVLLVSMVVVVY